MSAATPRLAVISPARDEEMYARTTIESVIRQTLRPGVWVIVDDGSTDATPEILRGYAERHPFIDVVTRPRSGGRAFDGEVIRAFGAGLATIDLDRFDYMCKLDLDLELPERYFETVIRTMENDPRLGSFSGKPFRRVGAALVPEFIGDHVSVGASKVYRTECFREIGGFIEHLMWDGVDCHQARLKGWTVRSACGPGLDFVHLRQMGSSMGSVTQGRMRHGRGLHYMGSTAVFVVAAALGRLRERPRVRGSAAIVLGYAIAALRREPQLPDRETRRFIRRFQRLALSVGPMRAARRLEAQQLVAWNRKSHGGS